MITTILDCAISTQFTRIWLSFVLLECLIGQSAYPTWAAETKPLFQETRDFEILVDDASAGTCTIKIADYDQGHTVASTTAKLKVKTLIYTYVYEYSGREAWLKNQLASLESRTVDGFSQLTLQAEATDESTTLRANGGRSQTVAPHFSTTNFWRLPAKERLNRPLAVLDADTGKTHTLRFEFVGEEKITLLGQAHLCLHYKTTGDNPNDLWFDGSGRLVRQVGQEDGHKTEMRLVNYRNSRG